MGEGKDLSQPPAFARSAPTGTHALTCFANLAPVQAPLLGLVDATTPSHPHLHHCGAGVPETEPLAMWKTEVCDDQLLLSCLGFSPVTAAPYEDLNRLTFRSTLHC